jgi:acetyl esterase/lipase
MIPLLALAAISATTDRPVLDLWPAGNPDGWHRNDAEEFVPAEPGGIAFVKNVSHPTLEIFKTSQPKVERPTVIVCPGGGYSVEAIVHEGSEIAERLNEEGFNAAILKYRLPNREEDKPIFKAPLQDAQRAIRLLRSRAKELGIDAAKIGIMGFSAGGHLAAATSTASGPTYSEVDNADEFSCKPAFTVLVYPAYLDRDGKPELPPEIHVDGNTPPVFITQAMNDKDYIGSSFSYALACQRAGVACELHLFPTGGHGFGLRSKEPGVSGWMGLLVTWLKGQ